MAVPRPPPPPSTRTLRARAVTAAAARIADPAHPREAMTAMPGPPVGSALLAAPNLSPALATASRAWRRRTAAGLPGPGAANQLEPVIEVTIGHIEIKAAAAPATPATRRPSPRGPSELERYLTEKGGRRP